MATHARIAIAPPLDAADLEAVRDLFLEYSKSLGFTLDYQGFDAELADLPGKYGPPQGALLLARVDGSPAGVVGLRPLDPEICEMKRLYVKPQFRGERTQSGDSLGRTLVRLIIAAARERGYRRLRLDTIAATMEVAMKLYRSMGFVVIAPYYQSPVPDTVYMELVL